MYIIFVKYQNPLYQNNQNLTSTLQNAGSLNRKRVYSACAGIADQSPLDNINQPAPMWLLIPFYSN
jgi:hypothetical protein